MARVKAAGGWIYDGRVCNILAVSRAFGDWEFKVRMAPGVATRTTLCARPRAAVGGDWEFKVWAVVVGLSRNSVSGWGDGVWEPRSAHGH